MKRLLVLALALAAAAAACDRVVDLSPPADAHHDAHGSDGGPLPDGVLPDAGTTGQDGGTIKDAAVLLD